MYEIRNFNFYQFLPILTASLNLLFVPTLAQVWPGLTPEPWTPSQLETIMETLAASVLILAAVPDTKSRAGDTIWRDIQGSDNPGAA